MNYLLRQTLNHDPPDLCLLSSQDYRHEPLGPSFSFFFFLKTTLCSSDWPSTHVPPASASQVLGLQVCTTMPSLVYIYYPCFHIENEGDRQSGEELKVALEH
jgi:hypothetical protein